VPATIPSALLIQNLLYCTNLNVFLCLLYDIKEEILMLIIGRRLICPNLLDGIASLQASPSLGSISLRWFVSPLLPFRYLANTTQGDAPLLHAARTEARNSFQKNAMLSPNSPESVAAVSHAEEVAKILKQNVVQGKKEGEDLYSKSFQFELETVS
jgi:hypothetical protein